MVVEPQSLESLSAERLSCALLSMLQAAAAKDRELAVKQAIIDKLTHESALLKRMKFATQQTLLTLRVAERINRVTLWKVLGDREVPT